METCPRWVWGLDNFGLSQSATVGHPSIAELLLNCVDQRRGRQHVAVDLLYQPRHRRLILRTQPGTRRPQRVSCLVRYRQFSGVSPTAKVRWITSDLPGQPTLCAVIGASPVMVDLVATVP